MNVIGCVPLAGRGLVARRGSLVAVTDGMNPGPDPLLTALAAVADANGDGAALALAGTRAAVERGRRPAWACAGVTFGHEVAVFVHGEAAAFVSVDGSPEAELMDGGSMIPVVRIFTGAVVTVRLVIGPTAAPDPRLWLDAGTVFGGGILVTIKHAKTQDLIPNASYVPFVAPTRPVAEQAVENMVFRPSASVPADVAPGEVYPEDVLPEPEFPEPVPPPAVPPTEVAYPAGYEPTMLAWTSGHQVGGPAGGPAAFPEPAASWEPAFFQEPAAPEMTPFPDDPFANPAGPAAGGEAAPDTESWFRNQGQPPGPTMRMTQSDGAGSGGLSEPPIADISTMKLVQLGAAEPVLVDGAMCTRMHFNAPDAMACRECGVSMRDIPRDMRRQPRPPLGVLLVDDGRGYTLDRDYVIGREPLLDGDVAAGRATPLPLTDPESSVSRLHLRVALVGWQVEVRDLGSSNGSVLYRAGGPRKLAPVDAAVLDPGARVGVGRRTVQFLPYSASAPSTYPHSAYPTA